MTFAQKVKNELCTQTAVNACCRRAELYGLLLFGRLFSPKGMLVQSENREIIDRAASLLSGLGAAAVPSVSSRGEGRPVLALHIHGGGLFESFGHSGQSVTLRLNRANLENDCCNAAFLRGAFLICGSMVDPAKDYHLEFVSPHLKLGSDLADLLQELSFEPKTIVRKGNFVVYFKESGQIEDMLTLMGAVHSSLELMDIKVYKDLRNKVNRVTNCETANIGKTVYAASEQIEAIRRLFASPGETLPEELREMARIRLEYPDASLRELAALAGISRSGVNHRLKRIVEIAKNQ